MFSAMELETAVRLKCNFVHLVWIDGHYDMVRFQEVAKYGRSSGVDFGPVNFVKLAESFGAFGLKIGDPDEIAPTLPAFSEADLRSISYANAFRLYPELAKRME
jgi:acetolactate synthase-1/2/3 large subunit